MTAVAVRPLPASPPEPGEVQPVEHEALHRTITGLVTGLPVLALASPCGRPGTACCAPAICWSSRSSTCSPVWASPSAFIGCSRTAASRRTRRCARPSRSSARRRSRDRPSRGSPTTASTMRSPTSWAIRTAHTSTTASGWRGALRGLLHAHMGWLFRHDQRGSRARYAPDLLADPTMRFVDRTFIVWALAGLALPFALGVAIGGSLRAGLTGAAVGRRRADPRPAPRHLQHQLDLPRLRAPALPDLRRVAQRVLARAAVLRRVMAQQPPRLPDLGAPRTRPLAVRSLRAGHPRRWRSCGLAWDVVRVAPERQRKAALPGPSEGV